MQPFFWTLVCVQKKHRFLTAVVNFVGYLDEKAVVLEGNNKKSDTTTRLLFNFHQSPQRSTFSDSARRPKEHVLLISGLSKQDTAEFLFSHLFFLSTRVVIGFSGWQEELQWPSADRTLDSKRDRFVAGSLSLEKCLSMCGRAHMYAHWDYFCWLIRTSSRKSCCGFTCWNVLFAPGNVFFFFYYYWFGNCDTIHQGLSSLSLFCHPALAISWLTKSVNASHSSVLWSVSQMPCG